jgi:GNAT superfamily N-acetyltransferase
VVRAFAAADWPALAAIINEVLVAGETYPIPPLDEAGARAYWFSQQHVIVAERDGVVVGSANMGPNRRAQGSHIGTASFMVAESARGQGVGAELVEGVIAWHRENGFRGIQFNAVVETNTAAVRLYERHGFTTIGVVPGAFLLPDGRYVGLHVMYLPLLLDSPGD